MIDADFKAVSFLKYRVTVISTSLPVQLHVAGRYKHTPLHHKVTFCEFVKSKILKIQS